MQDRQLENPAFNLRCTFPHHPLFFLFFFLEDMLKGRMSQLVSQYCYDFKTTACHCSPPHDVLGNHLLLTELEPVSALDVEVVIAWLRLAAEWVKDQTVRTELLLYHSVVTIVIFITKL